MDYIIGIDPGSEGALVALSVSQQLPDICVRFKGHNLRHRAQELAKLALDWDCLCFLENVHGFPRMGVSSVFNFGDDFGFLKGVLTAYGIPVILVTPPNWRRGVGLPSAIEKKDRKSGAKLKAQELFPEQKITLDTADAWMIAYYGLLTYEKAPKDYERKLSLF